MKQVYMGSNLIMAHMVEALLKQNDIVAYVGGETLNFYSGVTPIDGMGPTVHLAHDDDYDRARELIEEFEHARNSAETGENEWECATCGERMGPQFTACWKCSTARPE